ncbi:transporter substrate-binding domain-containing protein [Thermodesulfobacteriota bacterium]
MFLRILIYQLIFLFLGMTPVLAHVLEVKVGMYENPPKIFTNPAGKLVGIFPDILNHIAEQEGWHLTYVPGTWQECLDRLEAGELDIMMDVALSPAREKRFVFSAETIFVNYGTIYTRRDLQVDSFLDLAGRSIAVMKGSIHTDSPGGIKAQLQQFDSNSNRFIEVDDYKTVFSLLESKQADAGVVNRLFGALYQDEYGVQSSPLIFNPRQLRFAFAKDGARTPLLKERLDQRLRTLKQDHASIFHQTISAYLSGLPEPWTYAKKKERAERTMLFLNQEEKEWLKEHPLIRVASDPFWAPVEFLDDKGNHKGIAIDYLRRIEEILGVKFEVAQERSWQALIKKAKARQVDMFSCVTRTEERSRYLTFTRPYLSFPIAIFTTKNTTYINKLPELYGKQVAVVADYAIHEILRRDHPGLELVPVKNIQEGLQKLQQEEVTAFVGNLLTTSHYLASRGSQKIKVGGETPYKNRLSMAVRSDWPELMTILQKTLDSLSDEERNTLYRKWVPLTYEHRFDYTLLWKVLTFCFIILGLFLFWNRRLAREIQSRKTVQHELTVYQEQLKELVDIRTADLNCSNQQLRQEIDERILTEQALMIDEDRLEALLRLSQLTDVSEKDIIDFGLEEGVRLTESTVGYFHLISEDQINLELFTWNKEALKNCTVPQDGKYPLAEAGIWADSIRTREPAIHNDYQDELRKKGYPAGHVHISRHMSVPIFEKQTMIAIFGVGNKEAPYNESDVRQINLLAQGMWGLIQRQREAAEREDLEGQLRQTQKMEAVGTLAGGIAHDFNNILTAIYGFAELVKERLPEGSPAREDQQQVLMAASRAKDLVQQILAFSRQSEGELKPIHPHLIFKEALKLLRSSIPSTIKIRQNIIDCGAIMADPTQVHQIIMNLCTNAYQAMRESGGTLAVTLKLIEVSKDDEKVFAYKLVPGRYMRLEVSDTGAGMDKKTMAKIFDPYFTTKKMGDGTGLGLSVVHGIVESYGGTVMVYSEFEQGSTFHVYLPSLESLDVVPEAGEPPQPPVGGNETILVVDDEESIVRLQKIVLEGLGYTVLPFTSCGEALTVLQERSAEIDAVITDMTMPEMTGAEFSQRCFKIKPDMPIVLCTGFSELINEEQAKSLGIREFIMKPIIKKDLAAAVRRALVTG